MDDRQNLDCLVSKPKDHAEREPMYGGSSKRALYALKPHWTLLDKPERPLDFE
ncbi:MAG: hypothetical protein MI919_16805 [Holophagales bacterium]|nr:hypothetical protein [Holophagales bacterium]